MDLSELIGEAASCYIDQLDSSKVIFCTSLNLGIIMNGIVGFCVLVATVDLLPFLLTEYLEMQADFSGFCNLN